MFSAIGKIASRLHADESGEMPIGPMLIIGLIVIPLVVLLIAFKDKITDYLTKESGTMFTAGGKNDASGMQGKF